MQSIPLYRSVVLAGVLVLPLSAQFGDPVERNPEAAPVARALEKLGKDAQVFHEHVVTLANPFMRGRSPRDGGMELARQYFEYYLKQAGTEAPFAVEGSDKMSYRQAFPLQGRNEAAEQYMEVAGTEFTSGQDEDFTMLSLGAGGDVTAPVAFAGYAVRDSKGYTSFPEDEDLAGKIALVFRYEPTDEAGKSKLASGRFPWSRSSRLNVKAREIARRDAVGMILVDPPGVDDPRAGKLEAAGGGGRTYGKFPVAHMSMAAAERMLAKIAPGTTLESLRDLVAEDGVVKDLPGAPVTMRSTFERKDLMAENVGGVIRGRGALADEWIVVGGHLDHLGVGNYGSRAPSEKGEIHPGADDNATGAAAVLMLAEKVRDSYAELPEGASARSVLFIGFDAEELGLHGARYYTNNPLGSIDQHALMINFDMIGRIVNKRVMVAGHRSAQGMEEWLDPILEKSPLECVTEASMPGGSDHMAFMQKQVPYLFSIIADFHDDYHTPRDVSWKINIEDAVHTIHLYHEIIMAATVRSEPFVWADNKK